MERQSSPKPTQNDALSGGRWLVDGNNVFGSRPDGWWNDRAAAQTRFVQRVAEWCRTHADEVTLVFDAPLADAAAGLAGGNLSVVEARRRGRDAADDEIIRLVADLGDPSAAEVRPVVHVVTSDRGLRSRLPEWVSISGAGSFRELIGY